VNFGKIRELLGFPLSETKVTKLVDAESVSFIWIGVMGLD